MHRQEGELVIDRRHANGDYATSLPCVLCKKALDKYGIKWRAYYIDRWVYSTDDDIPKSHPTSRQNEQVFRRPRSYVVRLPYR